jgi:acrylyl-CoA reductase (NADPH)/3-hydroxypropionyl-CoA dehydratase/3-hydroxypropionyl-CoA synthetase
MAAGLKQEAEAFAEAIVDPDGGKTGIQLFMDKQAPPLARAPRRRVDRRRA